MFFKQFVRDDLGCASYLIGDAGAGECLVVDPQWDVAPYLALAEKKGMRLRYVIETHNHADHLSGHGKLAQQGAEVLIHESAGVDYPHRKLKSGDTLDVGGVRLRVLHTPGHRPEHISLAVSDTTRSDDPWLVLTGDALFVGDVGRPDLAVEPGEGAAQLLSSLRTQILSLGDGVEIYPAHVAGSLCGKAMSAKPSSTVGYERRFNPALAIKEPGEFVSRITAELPPQPPQFQEIVAKNRGPFITDDPQPRAMTADEFETMRRQGAQVLDTRSPQAFGGGHIPGALNVHLGGGQFGTRVAWVRRANSPLLLVLESPHDLHAALNELASTGQEGIEGYLLDGMSAWDSGGRPLESTSQMDARELYERVRGGDRGVVVLDVREESEWKEGHVPGAIHIPFHDLAERLDELPSHKPVATICASGTRSSIATSILQAEGFEPLNVPGGMDAWRAGGYPLE